MQITFNCPHCDRTGRVTAPADAAALACPHCGGEIRPPAGAFREGQLQRCLVCPGKDLFLRKDFPQRLGVAVVAFGIIGSSIAWAYTQVIWTFAILFASALIDVLLYALVGDVVCCYSCHAEYRDLDDPEAYGAFDLETHERYRQQAARSAGTTRP